MMQLETLVRSAIAKKITTERELRGLKSAAAGTGGRLPTNTELLAVYRELVENGDVKPTAILERLLVKRKIRSLSGVSVVTVLTKPFGCPGECTFCPTERGMPKSYLSNQPGAMRALRNEFDPYRQVRERVETLQACGHPAEKIELIILGGTWTALPRRYQTWFVKRCLQALNADSKSKIQHSKLDELQLANESAPHRLVGFTVETRPDWLSKKEIAYQRRLGVTRIELGAQSIYDDVLKITKRGHLAAKTVEAVRLLKNAGMKVGLHLMPNLPLSNPTRDIAMLRAVFTGGDYQPDQIKIYPCSVIPGTPLERDWRAGKYVPYDDTTLTDVIAEVYQSVPEWCRISRVVRDIPATSIVAGAQTTNLRQVLTQRGIRARDIHDREVRDEILDPKNIELVTRHYTASEGEEIFLSFEDVKKDRLVAFCRLRLPNDQRMRAFIREVHSYGLETPVGQKSRASQHRGYGRQLIAHAEKIAKKAGYTEMWIPAGVGVRPYYRKLGYELKRTYMAKALSNHTSGRTARLHVR